MGQCRRAVAEFGLAERVILHGGRPPVSVRERMAAASVLLQHSVTAANGDTEGLGISILRGNDERYGSDLKAK